MTVGEQRRGAPLPSGPSTVHVVVEDPGAHHARAVAAGATVVGELIDQDDGSCEYAAADPAGDVRSSGTHRPG
ncbi:hypothetical protein FSW04_16740 [Baekduia soli]|uniref:Glyoxalase-like domain-containing protein n=1 Tax=Baekduia soli TaxID=496014 RepID=A0A5B8U8B9_9ACTN|nr:VOC family protein [Baekduia soli]QEC49058.1 hypothetical protein FSW04_16740 [Baekduia soli]